MRPTIESSRSPTSAGAACEARERIEDTAAFRADNRLPFGVDPAEYDHLRFWTAVRNVLLGPYWTAPGLLALLRAGSPMPSRASGWISAGC